ncbi:MAG: pyocin knob domain-containing protein [Oscillospiraceae bacterium]|nr:pyocin knob domain-containing protein [Oscillospiraceae bacterium]
MITKNGYGYEEYEKELNWAAEYAKRELRKHREAVPIDHPDESVTTAKLADGSVTYDKLGEDVQNELTELENEINTHEETVASQTVSGHVTLSDEANMNVGAADGVAATPKAVYDAYEEVQIEVNSINQELNTHESTKATESVLGHVYITDTASASMPADTGKAASSYAVAYAVSNERTERQVADEALQASIAAEAEAREAADTELQSNIDAEAKAREAADTALQEQIINTAFGSDTQVGVDLDNIRENGAYYVLLPSSKLDGGEHHYPLYDEDSGEYENYGMLLVFDDSLENGSVIQMYIPCSSVSNLNINRFYIRKVVYRSTDGEVISRTDWVKFSSLGVIQELIDAEAAAHEAADATLQNNIDAEAEAREAADTALQSNIDAEAEARESADTTLQSNITAETTARKSADATLQTNINTEATTRKSADTTLQSNIDAEATARKSADSAMSADIEALQELSHTHENKSVLDSITGERVEIWDSNVDFAEYKEYANEIFAGMMRELQNLYAAIGVTLFDGGLFGEEYLGASLDGGYFTDTDLVDFDCGGFDTVAVSTASVDGGTY